MIPSHSHIAPIRRPHFVATLALVSMFATAAFPAAAAPKGQTCAGAKVKTARGCQSPGAVSREVNRIVRKVRSDNGMNAVIARVDVGRRKILRKAYGHSLPGVPATPNMHFRIGSMAIPGLTTIAFQLQEEGRLRLNDRLSKWLPHVPRSHRVTLRQLANNTSGYFDYIQGNQAFIDQFYADPFRTWKPHEMLKAAFGRGFACEPAACFNYSHANYILLSQVISKVTGKRTARAMRHRIFRPLGLRQTRISPLAPMPNPTLHSFTLDRGPYEDSTFWSPSWTIGPGTIQNSTIDDVNRIARGVLSGHLLSRRSRKQFTAPLTVGYPGFSRHRYFAQGMVAGNGWRIQNPNINGYNGMTGYLPKGRVSVSLVGTDTRRSAKLGRHLTATAFEKIAGYLTPGHPSPVPG